MIEKRFLESTSPVYNFEVYGNFILYSTSKKKIRMLNTAKEKSKKLTSLNNEFFKEASFKLIGNSLCYLEKPGLIKRYSFRTNSLKNCYTSESVDQNLTCDTKKENDYICDFLYSSKEACLVSLSNNGMVYLFFEGGAQVETLDLNPDGGEVV